MCGKLFPGLSGFVLQGQGAEDAFGDSEQGMRAFLYTESSRRQRPTLRLLD